MRVLIAARLSQLADGQTGIESQDAETQDWAEREGHTVVEVVPDTKSGTVQPWDRPNLRPWVKDPEKIVQYDAVVAYRLDRLSRGDKQSTNEIEAWAHQHGKQLLTQDGLVFPSEGVDGIRWDVTARIAHDEWLKISERYRRMQAYLRAENKLVGRPPFGYEVICAEPCDVAGKCKTHHKTLTPSPVGRKYVPEIFRRVTAGESMDAIARWLDAEGVRGNSKNFKGWYARSVGSLIRNPVYRGHRQDAAGKTELKVEPLVDAQVWARANRALDSKPQRGPILTTNRALLSGVLRCGKCAGPMTRIYGGTKPHRTAFYRCHGTGPERKSTCKNMIAVTTLDAIMDEVMSDLDRPVMEYRITLGHDHAAQLADLRYEMQQLSMQDLTWDAEDAERARLRAEYDRVAALPVVADQGAWEPTGETYAERWAGLTGQERGDWLRSKGVLMDARRNPFPDAPPLGAVPDPAGKVVRLESPELIVNIYLAGIAPHR